METQKLAARLLSMLRSRKRSIDEKISILDRILNDDSLDLYHKVMLRYYFVRHLELTPRRGGANYGVYRKVKTIFYSPRRQRSVAEHTYMLTLLTVLYHTHGEKVPDDEAFYDVAMLIVHDIAEIIIGDIPDDGTRDGVVKDKTEKAVIEVFICSMNQIARDKILAKFSEIQKQEGMPYLLDKLESVYSAIFYYMLGNPGSVLNCGKTTEQDELEMKDTGHTDPAHMWGWHLANMRRKNKHKQHPLIDGLLKVAYVAADGEVPAWLHRMFNE